MMFSLSNFVEVKMTEDGVVLAVGAVPVRKVWPDVVMHLRADRAEGQTVVGQGACVIGARAVAHFAVIVDELDFQLVHFAFSFAFGLLRIAVMDIVTANYKAMQYPTVLWGDCLMPAGAAWGAG
jgi:hypothetical protein